MVPPKVFPVIANLPSGLTGICTGNPLFIFWSGRAIFLLTFQLVAGKKASTSTTLAVPGKLGPFFSLRLNWVERFSGKLRGVNVPY